MVKIENLMGRTGNMMFWFAFGLNYARTHGITDSYFPQDPAWFEESTDYVKALFSQDIGAIDMVGIHVRRTDYLDENRIQYGLPLSYYEEAMSYFPEAHTRFIVCSDDIEWCKKQTVFQDCEFSEGKTEIKDMNLLASCKEGVIIANSTFSWWGAFLNPHNPKVIAPFKWDKDNKVFPMPKTWKQI